MGWPNNDPEGWDKVCRGAVEDWIQNGMTTFYDINLNPRIAEFLDWLQAEHSDIFQAMIDSGGCIYIDSHTADYFNQKSGVNV